MLHRRSPSNVSVVYETKNIKSKRIVIAESVAHVVSFIPKRYSLLRINFGGEFYMFLVSKVVSEFSFHFILFTCSLLTSCKI